MRTGKIIAGLAAWIFTPIVLCGDEPSSVVGKLGNDQAIESHWALRFTAPLSFTPVYSDIERQAGAARARLGTVGARETLEASLPITPVYPRTAHRVGTPTPKSTDLALSYDRAPQIFQPGGSMLPWNYVAVARQAEETQKRVEDSAEKDDPDRLVFEAIIQGWLPTIAGNYTVRGSKGTLGMDMGDIIDDIAMYGMGHLEARKGKWRLMFDGIYMELETDVRINALKLTIDLDYAQADVAVGYTVYEVLLHEQDKLDFELKLGTRYQYVKLKIDPNVGRTRSGSFDWQELLVGGQMGLTLSDRAYARASLDFSGFGIGSGSTLTWNFILDLRYKLTKRTFLTAGYRLLDIDWSNGSGSRKNALDIQMSGPIIGYGISF